MTVVAQVAPRSPLVLDSAVVSVVILGRAFWDRIEERVWEDNCAHMCGDGTASSGLFQSFNLGSVETCKFREEAASYAMFTQLVHAT